MDIPIVADAKKAITVLMEKELYCDFLQSGEPDSGTNGGSDSLQNDDRTDQRWQDIWADKKAAEPKGGSNPCTGFHKHRDLYQGADAY